MLEPARADGSQGSQPARKRVITSKFAATAAPQRASLTILSSPRPFAPVPVAPTPTIVRIALPLLLLAAVSAATWAAWPLLTSALYADAIVAATPAEAATMGLTSGRAVTLTVNLDDARRVRSSERGGAAWYAPALGDGTLLVRTDDVDRLRARPLTATGRVTTLGALGEDARTIAALRDAQGRPVSPETPVLVEQHVIATALLTGLALVVAWLTAAGSIWLLRWEAAPAVKRELAARPALREEPLPGA